jgi:hypothetical protein
MFNKIRFAALASIVDVKGLTGVVAAYADATCLDVKPVLTI